MNRLLKNIILLGIFSAATFLALLRSFGAGNARRAGHHQEEMRSNAKRYGLTIAVFVIAATCGGFYDRRRRPCTDQSQLGPLADHCGVTELCYAPLGRFTFARNRISAAQRQGARAEGRRPL
jgi:hypothetical protein